MTSNESKQEPAAEATSATRIRALRKALGLTQHKLGERMGVPDAHVAHLETGKNGGGSYATRAALAKGAGVGVEAMAAYLDGALPLAALLAGRGGAA